MLTSVHQPRQPNNDLLWVVVEEAFVDQLEQAFGNFVVVT